MKRGDAMTAVKSETRNLNVSVARGLRDQFSGLCRAQGRRVQDVVGELLEAWVAANAGRARWDALRDR